MNNKFPVLSFISSLLKVIGWVVVIIGVGCGGLCTIGMISENQSSSHSISFIPLVIGLAAAVIGLIVAATGESIGVLFAIEENTRRIADNLLKKKYKCPKCGAVVSEDDTTCPECRAVFYECNTCGVLVLAEDKKCPNCGTEWEEDNEEAENKLACKYCGAGIGEEDNFCPECGKKSN